MSLQIPSQDDYSQEILNLETDLVTIQRKLQVAKDMQKFNEILFNTLLDHVRDSETEVNIILNWPQCREVREKISECLENKWFWNIELEVEEWEKVWLLPRYLLSVRFSVESLFQD